MIKKLNRLFLAVVAIVLGTTAASAQSISVDKTDVRMTTGTTTTVTIQLTSDATKPVRDITFELLSQNGAAVVVSQTTGAIESLDEKHEATSNPIGQVYEALNVGLLSSSGHAYAAGENVAVAKFNITATGNGSIVLQNIKMSLDGGDATNPELVSQTEPITISVSTFNIQALQADLETCYTMMAIKKDSIAGFGSYNSTTQPNAKYFIDLYAQLTAYQATVSGYSTTLDSEDYVFTEDSFNEMADAVKDINHYAKVTYALPIMEAFDVNYKKLRDSLNVVTAALEDLTDLMGTEVAYSTAEAFCDNLNAANATYADYKNIQLALPTDVAATISELTADYRALYVSGVSAVTDALAESKATAQATTAYTDGATAMIKLADNIQTAIDNASQILPSEDNYNEIEYVNAYLDGPDYDTNISELSTAYNNLRTKMATVYTAYTTTYAEESETPANPLRLEAAQEAYEALVGDTIVAGEVVSPKYLYLAEKKNMNGYAMQMTDVLGGITGSLEETAQYNAFMELYKGAKGTLDDISKAVFTSLNDDPLDPLYKYKSLFITIPKTTYVKYVTQGSPDLVDPDDMVEIGHDEIGYLLDGYNGELEEAMVAMDFYHGNVQSAPATEYADYMSDWDASTGLMANLNTLITTEIATYDQAYATASTALSVYEAQLTNATDAANARFLAKYGVTDAKTVLANLNNGQGYKTYGDLLDEISNEINGYMLRAENIKKRKEKLDSLCAHFIAQSYYDADITMDETVNIGDYTAMVNYVIGRVTNPTLVQLFKANANDDADDVNYDANIYKPLIDAADITFVSNAIMGISYPARQRGAKAATTKENAVALELVSEEAGVRRFAVKLDNAEDYSAFQFDVTLNGDMVLADRTLGERANGQSIMSNELSENITRVLAVGFNAKSLKNNNEAIAYIDVMGEGEVELSNIRFSTPDATSASAANVSVSIQGEATGISNAKVEETSNAIFTIGGVKTNKLQKGVNIVGGRKVVK